jgi:replicative DNA helicase
LTDLIDDTPLAAEADGTARPVALAALVSELVADAEEVLRAASEGRAPGPVTGHRELDTVLGGYLRPGLVTMTGDPGAGKTALALWIAAACGCPALYVTAEQSPLELFRRVIARVTPLEIDQVRAAVPKRIEELAVATASRVPLLTFLDATVGAARPAQIIALADELKRRSAARHALVIVDAAQPWSRGVYRGAAETEALQEGLAALVTVAGAITGPVIVLSHRNRASVRERGVSEMVASKGTADFEHLSNVVIHLKRGCENADGYFGERILELAILKNRYGPDGVTVPATFNPKTQEVR